MLRTVFRNCAIAMVFTTLGYHPLSAQYRDYVRIPYPDSLKNIGLKVDVSSVLFNHVMVGFEVPLKKNTFFEFNLGVGGLSDNHDYGYSEDFRINFNPGLVLRTGFKLPVIYTSSLSIIYLMPEFAFTGFTVDGFKTDYNTGNQVPIDYNVHTQAVLFHFGYRHVNPRSGFFYDISMGYGVGFTNNAEYGLNAYTFFLGDTRYYLMPEQSTSGFASSFRGSVGWVIKKKKG